MNGMKIKGINLPSGDMHDLWECTVKQDGKNKKYIFNLTGNIENAYSYTIRNYGIRNFRQVRAVMEIA